MIYRPQFKTKVVIVAVLAGCFFFLLSQLEKMVGAVHPDRKVAERTTNLKSTKDLIENEHLSNTRKVLSDPNSNRPSTDVPDVSRAKPENVSSSASVYARLHHRFADALAAMESNPKISPGDRAATRALFLEACAGIARRNPAQPLLASSVSPDFETRKRAHVVFEKSTRVDRCDGIGQDEISESNIKAQWKIAADLGDARAIAAVLDHSLHSLENVADKIPLRTREPILIYKGPSEEETRKLLAGLGSKDPVYIASYGPLFSETFSNVDFVFGRAGEKLDVQEIPTFWNLVACNFGADCSANHREVAAHCAETGRCSFPSYEEYLRATHLSESQWAQYQRLLAEITNAINSGDWTNAIVRRSPPSGLEPIFYNQTPFTSRLKPPPG
jgi:hypothetical protein